MLAVVTHIREQGCVYLPNLALHGKDAECC